MAKKKTSTAKKHPGGRPTRYKAEYCEQARKLCLLGYTDKELADFFGVVESTINKWKKDHKEFSESLRAGKAVADADVADSFFKRAKGYTTRTEKPVTVSDGSGMGSHVEQHPIEVHVPGDPGAALNWLKNRQPDKWRDKQEVEHSGNISIGKPPTMEDAEFPE